MEKNEINDYIEKLKNLETELTENTEVGKEIDEEFITEFDKLLNSLSNDIQGSYQIPTSVMSIRVKKLNPSAVIPMYSKQGDAGMDLTAVSKEITNDYVSYKTGLSFEIPSGYVGLLFPRSSNSKKDLLLTNSVGVVDSGYRGEVELRFKPILNGKLDNISTYEVGDRVGQIIIMPYPQIQFIETDNLSDTERGVGGFGSSGK